MTRPGRRKTGALTALAFLLAFFVGAAAQNGSTERHFPQPKASVENALKKLQANLAGRLPVLDGFALPTEHSLDEYQRGYYQSIVQVLAVPSGGSVVRVSTKVTAWYSDPQGTHSGYQLLKSNGRLEGDLLDQLTEQLSASSVEPAKTATQGKPEPSRESESVVSAPTPKFPEPGTFSSSVSQGLAGRESQSSEKNRADNSNSALQSEFDSLQELLKNQAHPKNLVAVKKSGTPVVATPSLTAKTLFLASQHDEFEMLDFNQDWVHVRISGLSRGWIWRNSLEMPEGIPDTATHAAPAVVPAADLFRVTREEASQFPGDWQPLRGKSVKIISVQKVDENEKGGGAQDKLEYAKYLLDKNYAELQRQQDLAGVVLIFDSADGGLIAATAATLQQWKSGSLSDSALWHHCFFDPPEIFSAATPAGAQ
jgi:hypothetical protein